MFERTPAELDAWVTSATALIRESGVPYVALAGQVQSPADEAWLQA